MEDLPMTNDMDYSFLPDDFYDDEIVVDNNGNPCYYCGEESQFYNVTVGRSECEEHTESKEKDMI